MTGLGTESDSEAPTNKKRKRKEKKRQWVWTIGTNEDESDGSDQTPLTAVRCGLLKPAAQTPLTAIRLHVDKTEEKLLTILDQQSEKAGQGVRPALSEHAELSEQTRQNAMDLQPDGAEPIMATPPPEDFFSVQIPTFKIKFDGDTEMIDRPRTSHSI